MRRLTALALASAVLAGLALMHGASGGMAQAGAHNVLPAVVASAEHSAGSVRSAGTDAASAPQVTVAVVGSSFLTALDAHGLLMVGCVLALAGGIALVFFRLAERWRRRIPRAPAPLGNALTAAARPSARAGRAVPIPDFSLCVMRV
ncbi:hypothetical protein [Cellulomonas fimi]|uniref:Uncharacterized protein n=1 Tax=Cellulomonas fimi TaxID=1708 RepID=A0A7Y0M0H1_CELFI|nr:hypothetical protein [Cellulomonas fimi]NMR21566.1 hypothetical protein [Cellulomonas fimi]